jgi:hypothetical protein
MKKDLTYKRFGHLLVLEQTEKIGEDTHRAWLCLCDCGKVVTVRGYQLTNGKKTHCGCRLSNVIELTGIKFGRLLVIKYAGLDQYKNALWLCKCDCGEKVIKKGATLRDGRTQSCGCLKLEMNTADMPNRRKKDIVEKTSLGKIKSTNNQKNNTSGHKGVSRHSRGDKWVAYLSLNGKRIYLGIYDDLGEAIIVRKKAEEIYYKPIIEKYK